MDEEMTRGVVRVEVDETMFVPSSATIHLHDLDLKWLDEDVLLPGTTIEVEAPKADGGVGPIFDGEVVEVHQEMEGATCHVILVAYDRLHRLGRTPKARSFADVTDADIAKTMAQDAGLQAETQDAGRQHVYLLQSSETDLSLLRRRAKELAFVLRADGKKLIFAPPETGDEIELTAFQNLRSCTITLSTVGQTAKVEARGWDPNNATAIVGSVDVKAGVHKPDGSDAGKDLTQPRLGLDTLGLITDIPVSTQSDADKLAAGRAAHLAAGRTVVEGMADGLPELRVGRSVKLSGVGQRFTGTYLVTRARHSTGRDSGYVTAFEAGPLEPLYSSEGRFGADHRQLSLAIAVVIDNADPEDLGRVKVKLPWLADDQGTEWVRVAMPGAGNERGLALIPEIDDEVVVGFDRGDPSAPIVIGGLWSGNAALPDSATDYVSNSKVERRTLVSRAGHRVEICDSDSGPYIHIMDKDGNGIEIDAKKGHINITAKGDVNIECDGNMNLTSKGDTTIEASGTLTLKGGSKVVVDAPAVEID